jgi:hypothetical protein
MGCRERAQHTVAPPGCQGDSGQVKRLKSLAIPAIFRRRNKPSQQP